MTSKHTPGPWKVTHPKSGRVQISHSRGGMVGHAPQICAMWRSSDVTEANARLIAAAPELLEKLQQLLSAYEQADHRAGYCCCGDDMERHGDPMDCGHTPADAGEYAADNVIRDVKALIAKATGGAE